MRLFFTLLLFSTYSLVFSASSSYSEFLNNRLEEFKKLASNGIPIDLEGLQREVSYELSGLTHFERIKNEKKHFIETIQTKVREAYQYSLSITQDPEQSRTDVLDMVEKDLKNFDEDFQPHVRRIALNVLNEGLIKVSLESFDLTAIDESISEMLKQRKLTLLPASKREIVKEMTPVTGFTQTSTPLAAGGGPNRVEKVDKLDSDYIGIMSYPSREALVEALTVYKLSERWVSMANTTTRVGVEQKSRERTSVKLYAEFMGTRSLGGKEWDFYRIYSSYATVMAEGSYPAYDYEGRFDFFRRDGQFNIMTEDEKPLFRHMYFTCIGQIHYESYDSWTGEIRLRGEFFPLTKFVGAGGAGVEYFERHDTGKVSINNVTMNSRRVQVPMDVGGKEFTLSDLISVCNNDYLDSTVSNGRTVKQNLDTMMRNLLAGMTYTHRDTVCNTDSHCNDWFDFELNKVDRYNSKAECHENTKNGIFACKSRGTTGSFCPLYEGDGFKLTRSNFEKECARGYSCVEIMKGRVKEFFGKKILTEPYVGECRKIRESSEI